MRCDYFALCENHAEGYVTHPILGWVATCKRCVVRVGLTDDLHPMCEACQAPAVMSLISDQSSWCEEDGLQANFFDTMRREAPHVEA
jgi:hypothetical protein